MRIFLKAMIAIAVVAPGFGVASAQSRIQAGDARSAAQPDVATRKASKRRSITSDDRLSLLAAALDARVQRESEPDCSHLVHAIYDAAGFPYDYAPSSELYAGVGNFQRVKAPLPGDLVVWQGHVGMVVKPSRHIFFSYLSSGPGTDDYEAAYWKSRGRPRFYRYIKTSPPLHKEARPRGPQT